MTSDLIGQLEQLNKIKNSYSIDIKTLNKLLDAWEPEKTSPDKLANQIKTTIRNASEISIKANELNQYLIEIEFKPIMVSLVIDK